MGLSSLSPEETEKIHSANRGHKSYGPSSSWVLREFQLLEGTRDARRAAGLVPVHPRRTTSVRFVSSPTVFNFGTVCLWAGPLLNKFKIDLSTGVLFLFIAPAALSTLLFIGLSEDDKFRTSAAIGFGTDFWNSCVYDATLERSFVSLRAGDQADLTPLGRFSSPLARHLLRVLRPCAPFMSHGRLALLLVLCWRTFLPLVTLLHYSMGLLVFRPVSPL